MQSDGYGRRPEGAGQADSIGSAISSSAIQKSGPHLHVCNIPLHHLHALAPEAAGVLGCRQGESGRGRRQLLNSAAQQQQQ